MLTDQRHTMIPRWIAGIVGMLVGQAVWALSLFAAMAGVHVFAIIAAPVALLGWIFIWGDNGPPHWLWLDTNAFHYVFGVCFYGLLGALVGLFIIRRRFSLRTLLVGMTLVAIVLGLIVWAMK